MVMTLRNTSGVKTGVAAKKKAKEKSWKRGVAAKAWQLMARKLLLAEMMAWKSEYW